MFVFRQVLDMIRLNTLQVHLSDISVYMVSTKNFTKYKNTVS